MRFFRRRSTPSRQALLPALALVALIAASLPRGAAAEITPEAREVVERHVEAIGGRAAFDSIRTLRIQAGVSAIGLTGTVNAYTMRPASRASVTVLGPLRLQEGLDGERAWRIGPDGKLAMLDGLDLDRARASGYFENNGWLAADQGGGKVRVHSYDRDSGNAYTILEVTPPVGQPRRFWVNQSSGLIDRSTMRDDQRDVTILYSDHRMAGGLLTPHRSTTRIAGMPANDIVVTLDSVWVNREIPPARFAPPAPEAPTATYLKTPGVARIPFEYRQRHVWFKASVNGSAPLDFLYDTGASITVIDSAAAVRLGLETRGRMQAGGAGAAGGASFAEVDTIRIETADGDGIALGRRQVAVLSLNPYLAPFFWRDCAGVIGYDVITEFINEIDFDTATLTLRDPKAFTYQGSGATIPFRLAGTVPVIPFKLDGAYEGEARLDVGSSSTVDLHSPFVKRHGLLEKSGRVLEVTGGGFGGTFTSNLVRMKRLEVGPYKLDDPLVVLSGATEGALASEDYAGNAGNHLMERFKVTFDYERRVIHLEPSKRFRNRDRFSLSGVQLVRMDGRIAAMEVIPDSPADQAGIQQGDEVTSIDDRPIESLTPEDIRRLFEDGAPGQKVKIAFVRDGKTKKKTLKLAEIL